MRTKRANAAIASFFLLSGLLSAAAPDTPPLKPVPESPSPTVDPYLEKSWHLKSINAFDAWKVTKGNPNVTIGVIDSGIDYNHAELAPNLRLKSSEWPPNDIDDDNNGYVDDVIGWDYVQKKALPWDRSGHGTFIAGLIAAAEGNGVGSAGVCPKCTLLTTRFLNADGFGDTEDEIEAIRYSMREGVSVINISSVGEGYDKDLHDVLKLAAKKDIVVVVAAGNDRENIDYASVYPAKFELPNMLTVAATTEDDELLVDSNSNEPRGSNWGKKHVHLGAPGDMLIGPWIKDEWWFKGDGTSFSAPIVAGAVGLIRSANPTLSASQVVRIILSTTRKVEALESKLVSGGVLDVAAAMECATKANPPCLLASPAY